MSHVTYECVMSYGFATWHSFMRLIQMTWMSHMLYHMNESYGWVQWRTFILHEYVMFECNGTYDMNVSCHLSECSIYCQCHTFLPESFKCAHIQNIRTHAKVQAKIIPHQFKREHSHSQTHIRAHAYTRTQQQIDTNTILHTQVQKCKLWGGFD